MPIEELAKMLGVSVEEAKGIVASLKGVDGLTKSQEQHKAELALLRTEIDELKSMNIGKVLDGIEHFKARFRSVIDSIRTSKGGFYIPGIEDGEAQKFSMLRAMVAIRTRNWDNAGLEKEIFDQAREKSQRVGVGSDGGFFVPDQIIPEVIAAIYARSVLIALDGAEGQTRVSVIDGLTGSPVKIPKFEGGTIAYWIGEEDAYVESKAKVGNVSMTPKKLGILVKLTEEMGRMGGFGFENLLRNDMIRSGSTKIDATVLYGKGTENEPRGVFNMKKIQRFSAQLGELVGGDGQPSVPNPALGGELDFDALDEMLGSLEDADINPNDSFAWIMSPRYRRRLRKQKVKMFSGQTEEMAYVLGSPMFTDAELQALIGDFGASTQVASKNNPGQSAGWTTNVATNKYGDVVGANWSEVIFGRWSGTEIVDDGGTGTGFINDTTLMKLRMFADIQHRQELAIVACPDAQTRD